MKAPSVTPGDWQIVVGRDATGYPTFALCGLSGDQKRDADVLSANACMMQASKQLAEALHGLMRNGCFCSDTEGTAHTEQCINAIRALLAAGYED